MPSEDIDFCYPSPQRPHSIPTTNRHSAREPSFSRNTPEDADPTAAREIPPPRNQAAAPPLYLLVLALIPTGVALYVCAFRRNDYQHEGFDIIAGSAIGAVFAWGNFRFYHLPIRRCAGWAWGPRSRDRAFFVAGSASGWCWFGRVVESEL